jgi:hypothetical protein
MLPFKSFQAFKPFQSFEQPGGFKREQRLPYCLLPIASSCLLPSAPH